MSCGPSEVVARALVGFAALLLTAAPGLTEPPSVVDVLERAERQRGVGVPCRFVATIHRHGGAASAAPDQQPVPSDASVVAVQADGFARQLVFVQKPSRGDVMLVTADAVWLRPRRLHRLTRVPPDLRMFNGASVSDVTAIDVRANYVATLRDDGASATEYVVDLVAKRDGVRYPRATYRIQQGSFLPLGLELMAASGKELKRISYARFETVLGRNVPTMLTVEDLVFHDTSVVRMSDFEAVPASDPAMFLPDHLLTLPDLAS